MPLNQFLSGINAEPRGMAVPALPFKPEPNGHKGFNARTPPAPRQPIAGMPPAQMGPQRPPGSPSLFQGIGPTQQTTQQATQQTSALVPPSMGTHNISIPSNQRPPASPQNNRVAPQIEVADPDYDQFSDFSDAAYEDAQRYMRPEIDRRTAEFEQSLINRGIDPNSEAGMQALNRHQVGLNDLQNSAQYGALQEGRGYQQQLWEQEFGQAGLDAGILQSQIAADASMHNAQTGASASRYGSDRSLEGLLAGLTEGGRQFDEGLTQRGSEFDRNLDQRRDEFGANREDRRYEYDRQGDLAEFLAYTGRDLDYGRFGLDQADFDLRSRNASQNDLWRFLSGLPVQSVGPYGPNQGAAVQGVGQGARTGAGIYDAFSGWPGG